MQCERVSQQQDELCITVVTAEAADLSAPISLHQQRQTPKTKRSGESICSRCRIALTLQVCGSPVDIEAYFERLDQIINDKDHEEKEHNPISEGVPPLRMRSVPKRLRDCHFYIVKVKHGYRQRDKMNILLKHCCLADDVLIHDELTERLRSLTMV